MDSLSFGDRVREETRLQILRCLAEAPEYTASDGLLHGQVNTVGVVCSLSQLRAAIYWLNELGLLVAQRAGGELGITLATLTSAGIDVAAGRERVPGVARPRPGS